MLRKGNLWIASQLGVEKRAVAGGARVCTPLDKCSDLQMKAVADSKPQAMGLDPHRQSEL